MFSQGKALGQSPSTSAHNPSPSPSTVLETELVTMGVGGCTAFPDYTILLQTVRSARDEIKRVIIY